jgi:hypothetical protein
VILDALALALVLGGLQLELLALVRLEAVSLDVVALVLGELQLELLAILVHQNLPGKSSHPLDELRPDNLPASASKAQPRLRSSGRADLPAPAPRRFAASVCRRLPERDLRFLELAWSGSIIGQWGYEVALAVFAYRAGGATAVGVVALIRLLPAAIVAPFAALLGVRFPRKRVMVFGDLVRACAMGGAAAAVFGGAPA